MGQTFIITGMVLELKVPRAALFLHFHVFKEKKKTKIINCTAFDFSLPSEANLTR